MHQNLHDKLSTWFLKGVISLDKTAIDKIISLSYSFIHF